MVADSAVAGPVAAVVSVESIAPMEAVVVAYSLAVEAVLAESVAVAETPPAGRIPVDAGAAFVAYRALTIVPAMRNEVLFEL